MKAARGKDGWWYWAWRLFAMWSRLDLDAKGMGAGERWAVVLTTLPAGLRAYYLRPARSWLLSKLPKWVCVIRLQRAGHDWYGITSQAAAEHVRLRFDIYPVDIDDLVRIHRDKVTAVAYAGSSWFEVVFLQPNGEIEPDPNVPATARARAATRGAGQ